MITLQQYKNKNIGIIGLGKTGISSAKSLINSGANVYLFDDNTQHLQDTLSKLKSQYQDANIFANNYNSFNWQTIDTLIVSPGIPLLQNTHKAIKLAQENNCRITSDIELFWEQVHKESKLIAITGTNGKSTTSKLIHHILRQNNINASLIGNIGNPVLESEKADIYVIEISSFQLDILKNTVFDIGILLNITPDHMDRYQDINQYIESKKRIFYNQKIYSILNIDNKICSDIKNKLQTKTISISSKNNNADISIQKDSIIDNGKQIKIFENPCFNIKMNSINILAAYAACKNFVTEEGIINAIESFKPLNHRMEIICKYGNIMFINDSKATNAASSIFALESLVDDYDVYWIAGGKDKHCSITDFTIDIVKKIVKCFSIGETGEKVFNFLIENNVKCEFCNTMQNALNNAFKEAYSSTKESVIILSPGFSSFDQWSNFEHRGNIFKELVIKSFITNK